MQKKVLQKLEYDKMISQLVNKAVSKMAKDRCEALEPSTDINEIKIWQRETAQSVSMLLKRGSIPLGGIKDIRSSLERIRLGASLSAIELLYVAEVLRVCKKVKNYSRDERDQSQFDILDNLFFQISPLTPVYTEISRCIISEEEIDDNASATLKKIRREINLSHDRIKQQLNKIIQSNSYRNMLQDAVVTMRGDRYCVPVKQEYRSQFKGMIHDQSSSGNTLFIEPMAVVQLNNQLRELYIQEKEEIERILEELTLLVHENYEDIKTNLQVLTELDFIFAKGQLALGMNATEPIFNDRGFVHIKKGRHPLLDSKTVVPIEVYLGKEFTTLMITGPNTGGKTVTLKTIGLFTLMGQAGLHIPALDQSELAVFKKVFADIGDEQSIEQSLSTFSSHMVNIVDILANVDEESLVLFDELGAGTDPTEGAALAMAILQNLHWRSIRTVATTHYSELKVYALSTDGVENACCEFDVKTLQPTYRLLIGIPGKSNAFAISKRLGLKDDIINLAKEQLEQNDVRFEDLITDLEISKKTAEYEKDRAVRYREEAERLKEKSEEQKQKIADQKEKILSQAREEARDLLQDAKTEADDILKRLNKAAREKGKTINFNELEADRAQLRDALGDVEKKMNKSLFKNNNRKAPKSVKKGDKVFVDTFNQEAVVISTPDSKGDVTVQAGIMKLKVNMKNLRIMEEKEQHQISKPVKKGRTHVSKARNIKTELDLRGCTVEEALGEIDKYIDDAYLANLAQVTIIHGKGTGALRAAIHQYLKRNGHVKAYRLGKYGEGESGVTIVEL
ncbi:endonuclease MutS2 [Vallitalea okinawensis]|uniref:endonuclease MutS2 n=1 Tax=Vallitalea okinawensis TaxID=2078660 RepID=UPI000CFCED9A|nr:endonuclease MutS2 [Vallitalea okinawensis]